MSRSRGSLPFIRCPGLFLSHEPFRRLDHLLNGDAQMLIDGSGRRGRAEALDAEYHSVVANPAIPRHRVCRLHRDAFDSLRQHAVAISLILRGEELVTRPADGARANAVGFELFLSVEN